MKKFIFFLLLFLNIASLPFAQDKWKMGGGLILVPENSVFKGSIGGSAAIDCQLSKKFDFRTAFGISVAKSRETKLEEGKYSVGFIEANALYYFYRQQPLYPYIGIGLSYYDIEKRIDVNKNNWNEEHPDLVEDVLGYNLRVGWNMPIHKNFFLNFDIKYFDIAFHSRVSKNPNEEIHLQNFVYSLGITAYL